MGGPIFLLISSIYNYLKANIDEVIRIGAIVAALVILVILARLLRRRRYWKWYYSRERGLSDISSPEYLLIPETNCALEKTSTRVWGCNHPAYINLKKVFETAFLSDKVVYVVNDVAKELSPPGLFQAASLLNAVRVSTDGDVFSIFIRINEDGGYRFVILPDKIYAFIIGPHKFTFVGAYCSKIFGLNADYLSYRKEYFHITDMSHKPSGYFLRYCDITDSDAFSAGWRYETSNGYRDGRRQSNNSFIVNFKFTEMKFTWGALNSIIACSDSKIRPMLELVYPNYMQLSDQFEANANSDNHEFKAGKSQTAQSMSGSDAADSSEGTLQEEAQSAPISCDDARSRNRDITKKAAELLNRHFQGKPEYKTFQVRKPREGWAMQDAEIYTYLNKDGVAICLEFILRTKLETNMTYFEYKISCDNPDILDQYLKPIIVNYLLESHGASFSGIIGEQRRTLETNISLMIDQLSTEVITLTDEALALLQ